MECYIEKMGLHLNMQMGVVLGILTMSFIEKMGLLLNMQMGIVIGILMGKNTQRKIMSENYGFDDMEIIRRKLSGSCICCGNYVPEYGHAAACELYFNELFKELTDLAESLNISIPKIKNGP